MIFFAHRERHAQPAHRKAADCIQVHLAALGQIQHVLFGEDRLAIEEDVLARAMTQQAGFVDLIGFVYDVRELQRQAVLRDQRNEQVPRVDQLAGRFMHAAIELGLADIGGGQLGDLEQRFLQVFGALALDDFELQNLVGLGEFERALVHALLEIVLAEFAFQCDQDVAADEFQQGQIVRRSSRCLRSNSAPRSRPAHDHRAAAGRRASRGCPVR